MRGLQKTERETDKETKRQRDKETVRVDIKNESAAGSLVKAFEPAAFLW